MIDDTKSQYLSRVGANFNSVPWRMGCTSISRIRSNERQVLLQVKILLFPLIQLGWWKQPWRENYLKERNFLQDKFLRFSGIFVKFAKLNPRKKIFFSFFRISKIYISTLGSLSINDNHVKNILLDIKQSRIKSYPNNVIWNIKKLGQEFIDSHTTKVKSKLWKNQNT